MRTKLHLATALLCASALASLVLAGTEEEAPTPTLGARLKAAVRIEVRAPGDRGWKPPFVLTDSRKVRQISAALAALPLYKGEPAGWVHAVQIKFVAAKGESVVTHTFGAESLGNSTVFLGVRGEGERLVPRKLAKLLLPLVKAAEAMPATPPIDLRGTWEGQVLYTQGTRAKVRLELKPGKAGDFEGTYTLREQGEHGLGKAQVAPLTASLHGKTLNLRLPRGRSFKARLGDAGAYAEHALYGSFNDSGREGVFVLWRYAGR